MVFNLGHADQRERNTCEWDRSRSWEYTRGDEEEERRSGEERSIEILRTQNCDLPVRESG